MASVQAERKEETSVLTPQDRNVVVNGEYTTSCRDKDTVSDCTQLQESCGTKKVTDLNGVAICSQSCQSTTKSGNHLTLSGSSEASYDPSIKNLSAVDEKQCSEQAGPSEAFKASCNFSYVSYESELQMEPIMALITKDLSEPYSIYTYRYFIHNWPKLCFLVSCLPVRLLMIMMMMMAIINSFNNKKYLGVGDRRSARNLPPGSKYKLLWTSTKNERNAQNAIWSLSFGPSITRNRSRMFDHNFVTGNLCKAPYRNNSVLTFDHCCPHSVTFDCYKSY